MVHADDLASGTWLSRRPDAIDALRVRKCRLEVLAGPDQGVDVVCAAPEILIGRGAEHLRLSDRKVSGLHCEIRLDDRGYRLRDLGSTNGTYVAGMRVFDVYLPPGAIVSLGDTSVRFTPLGESVEYPLWRESRLGGMVGASAPMRRLFDDIARIAAAPSTVLVTGETGTGKELVAEAIHELSPRASGPFVVLDCGAVPPRLFEDQLFGHEPGAFTGATTSRAGVFEAAHGGTLFLDEIGELPVDIQPKLLRVLEARRVRRLGSTRDVPCDVRVVAATHRDLPIEVNRGSFRADLYYRIAVAVLRVPPLRDRPGDVDLLIEHFLDHIPGGRSAPLPDEFLQWARRHPWPGNVRELRNAVESAVALGRHGAAPSVPRGRDLPVEVDVDVPFKQAKQQFVDAFDRCYVTKLLERHGGNVSAAARAAGIDRMSIYKMLQRLGIPAPSGRRGSRR